VDVDKYLRWLTGVICTQNYDGFVHNYALYRNSASGLFEMIPWDYDGTWGRDCNGKEMRYNYVPIEGYNTLTARILDVPQFRAKYRALIEEVLDTTFTVEALENDIIALHEWIRPSLLNDPYKQEEVEQFDKEPDLIFQFIRKRNEYLKEHLSDLE
jgi:spore coat protein H